MPFEVGQEVVCIKGGPFPNPWHNAHPIIKGKHYIVLEIGFMRWGKRHALDCIRIDQSPRLWQADNFRPIDYDPITVLEEEPVNAA